ncbi:hypothetical protein BDM02DRAFT_3185945 [Thelephora ganbajun]|uniref:Uncharacterized protein n=1 Tax=Thelephora ganbajun TaxID=370292 RepID=A0ACB6ZJY1_THEGA|nr:hypothetical protein BDM02DRAFT_3185945 [Thelephora ganbajun]
MLPGSFPTRWEFLAGWLIYLAEEKGCVLPGTSPSVAYVLISHTFTPGLVQSILAQFSNRICSLLVSLPHKELERLSDLLPPSDGLCYMDITSITGVIPFPPGLTHHLTPLTTLVLHNILPTWKPLKSLATLTTLLIICDFQPSTAPPNYEYRISDFFELLLCTPRLRHLRLSGIGPTNYNVTPEWIVPLEYLETLDLHCQLQAEILHHLSISLDTRVISVHARVRSALLNAGAVSCVTPSSRKWQFIPFRVDVYQEGVDRCRLLFVGIRLWNGSRDDLAELPAFTLEVSVTNTIHELNAPFSGQCIRSFQPLSTTNIQELTIHSYRCPRRQTSNPVYDMLSSLSALRRLVLKGCKESPFYKALSRVEVEGKRGKRRLFVVCPHLIVVEIDPIVGFRRFLGDRTPPSSQLATDLSVLMQERKGRGASLKMLDIVFPAQCEREARRLKEQLVAKPGVCTVSVRVV